VSRDFELGTNVSCEESTISPCIGLILTLAVILLTITIISARIIINLSWKMLSSKDVYCYKDVYCSHEGKLYRSCVQNCTLHSSETWLLKKEEDRTLAGCDEND